MQAGARPKGAARPTCLPDDEMTDLDKMVQCQPVDDKAEPEPVPAVLATGSKDDPMAQLKEVLKSVNKGDVPIYDDDNPPSTSSEEPAPTPGSARALLKLARQQASFFFPVLFFKKEIL